MRIPFLPKPPPSDPPHVVTLTPKGASSASDSDVSGVKDPLLPSQKTNLPPVTDNDNSDVEHEDPQLQKNMLVENDSPPADMTRSKSEKKKIMAIVTYPNKENEKNKIKENESKNLFASKSGKAKTKK